ncbi:MAG: AMIN domain-containing protein, partial [Candidatus Zixiibacteriota bacterium]
MRRKKILKTKPLLTFVSFIFCVAVGSLFLPGSTEGSCRINDISLEKMGNFTKVTIYADKPFEFVHSTLDKKDGKPYRVIIDCKDAIHNLPQYNFKNGLPQGTIKAIRTSQFQAEPEKIVRIVLDLEKPIIYKVTEKGEEKRGGIAILTTQEPSFPFWAAAKDEKGASKTKSVSPIRVEKINNIKSQAEENFLTSSENKSWFDFEWTENARPEEVKKRTAFERSLCFADTSETETNLKAQNSRSQVSEVLIAKPEIEKKEVATIKKASGQTGGRMVLATVGTSPVIFSVPNQNDENLQSGQVRQKRVGTDRKQETSKGDLPPASMSPKKERASATQKWDSRMVSSRHSVREEYVQKEQTSSEEEMTFSAGEVRKKVNEAVEESETAPENLTAKITEERIEKESISSPGKLVFTAGKSEQTAKEPPEKIKNSFIGPNTESRAVSHTGGVQETTKEPAEENKADLSDLTTREEEVAFLSPE